MKKIYINLFSFILLVLLAGISNDAKAQKNLKLRITRIEAANTAGTDCDANCLNTSDNQIDWVWDIDDGGTDVDEACLNKLGKIQEKYRVKGRSIYKKKK